MTKKDKAIRMMQRPQGASGRELEKALGWLPHTVRGFLSIQRKHGIKARRVEKGERAAYVIRAKVR